MEAVAIIRLLWRQRFLVALGLVVALSIGIATAYKVGFGFPPKFESRQYQVGIASAEVLVDSPSSQVADIGGGSALTDVSGLASRSRLLANLMAVSPLKEQIARRAGIDPRTLVATAPSTDVTGADKVSPLDSKASGAGVNRLSVEPNEILPIIGANATAATPELAARIAAAAVAELKAYLNTIAAADRVPGARQLVISPLGPARSATVVEGPRRLFAFVAVLLVFGLWCAGIAGFNWLARGWREAAAAEEADALDASTPELAAARRVALATERALNGADAATLRPPSRLSEAPTRSKAPNAELAEVRNVLDSPERPQRRGRVA